MKISIIVPFYNVELYFRECLDSIVNQTYRDLEIILVDDCSPDNSLAIAKEYAGKDKRITIIEHEKNLRQGGARNSGLKIATGEYIWFIDSDDMINGASAIENIVTKIKNIDNVDNPDIIAFGFIELKENGTRREKLQEVKDFELITSGARLHEYQIIMRRSNDLMGGYPWLRWFKRSFWQKMQISFLEHIIYEDVFLIYSFSLARNILILEPPYYLYRKRSGSTLTSNYPINFDQHLIKIWNQCSQFYTIHKGNIELNFYYYATIGLIRSYSFVRVSWVYCLSSLLKKEPQRSRELYEALFNLLKPIIAIDPSLKSMSWINELSKHESKRIITCLRKMDQKGMNVDHYKVLNQLFEEKSLKKRLKNTIQNFMPFGLLKIILIKRGWTIIIKKEDKL